MSASKPLSPLQARWLAEIVRRHESAHAGLEDAAAVQQARAAAADLEARILVRAAVLGEREGWRDAVLRWTAHARLALLIAAALALVLGFGAATGVLGDGSRPVNVVWAVLGLLGVHLLSLLLWLLGLGLRGRAGESLGGGVPARLWLRLVALFERRAHSAELPLALGGLIGQRGLAAWGLSAVSHGLWALALLGAVAGLLLLLATRRYGFVWETTILPAQTFLSLTAALGHLPALLGFPVPDAATVLASGDAPMGGESARRAWSGWLLGVVLLYGVLPRVLLALLCAGLWRRALAGLRLDLSRHGFARLRARLLPASERIGVLDPERPAAVRASRHAVAAAEGGSVLLALELGDDLPWPPAFLPAVAAQDCGRVDSREQRRAMLARLALAPPARLLIAVDARSTPDRGSLGLISELSGHAFDTRVWALAAAADSRQAQWRAGLQTIGLDGAALLLDAEAARAWLDGPVPEAGS